jgi:hypothetical protein
VKQKFRSVAICHQSLRLQGGMEHYAIVLARSFRELGLKVAFYARTADARLASELGVDLKLSPQRRTPLRKLGDWQYQRFVKKSLTGMEGLQIALSRVTVRDLAICGGTHLGYVNTAGIVRGPFDLLQVRLEKQAYAAARLVVSHSDLCTGELRQLYGLPPRRIETLYPPVEKRFSAGDRQESRRELGLPARIPILLFPSMGHGRKGLKQICAALAELDRPFALAVAGKPTGAARWPFVRSLGYVDRMETAYRAADFTILGSSYEPFGLVGPESVLCGTRLIFDENIGCLSAIDKRAVTLFNARDKESILRAVRSALDLRDREAHSLSNPRSFLRYDPDPLEHGRALLRLAGRGGK